MPSARNMETARTTKSIGIKRIGRRIMLVLIDLRYDKLNVMCWCFPQIINAVSQCIYPVLVYGELKNRF